MLNVPPRFGRRDRSPFMCGEHARKLCLVLCDDDLGKSPVLDLVRTLGRHRDSLHLASTSGSTAGCVMIEPTPGVADRTNVRHVYRDGDETVRYLYGTEWCEREAPAQAEEHLIPVETAHRYLLLAHHSARWEEIDGLVAAFPRAMARHWTNMVRRAPLLTDGEALALVGLYLRAHGDFTVEHNAGATTFLSPQQFYRAAGANLLRQADTWLVAAHQRWRGGGSPELFGLAEAVIERLARALKARDYLQVRAHAGDARDAWSDVLFFFEVVLLSLQGSLDAAARFVHGLYAVPSSRRGAAWSRGEWRREVVACGGPQELLTGERFENLRAAIGDLRNSIHGEVLSGEFHDPSSGATIVHGPGTMVLDPDLTQRVKSACDAEGGVGRWGILGSGWPQGVTEIVPWLYAETAIATVADVLAAVIRWVNRMSFDNVRIDEQQVEFWLANYRRQLHARLLIGVGYGWPFRSQRGAW